MAVKSVKQNVSHRFDALPAHPDNLATAEYLVYVLESDGLLYLKIGTNDPIEVGSNGTGVPNGGTTGQVLQKLSNDDGDADWQNLDLTDIDPADLQDFITSVPPTVNGVSGNKAGQIAFDSTHTWFCFQDFVNSSTRCWYKVLTNDNTGVDLIVSVPATPTSSGIQGQIAFDVANSFIYYCTATNTWRRVATTFNTW